MQLVAYGAQDVYLTGNPQITFWKVSYKRYTNFAMESIEQTFNGQADFGRRVTCTISRNGDLAYRTYLQVTLPEINQQMKGSSQDGVYARWLDFPGEQIVSQVEVEIGGAVPMNRRATSSNAVNSAPSSGTSASVTANVSRSTRSIKPASSVGSEGGAGTWSGSGSSAAPCDGNPEEDMLTPRYRRRRNGTSQISPVSVNFETSDLQPHIILSPSVRAINTGVPGDILDDFPEWQGHFTSSGSDWCRFPFAAAVLCMASWAI